ncbi:hypothetical protein C0989_002711 [Termitomyces sp. Mn162]|nr:hypothetical protein C0989_002711 [Termitomyces sp. Mn162]
MRADVYLGFLTATASEDWALVLEVTERVALNESNAKEAARALRREFKYGEPTAQLAAARLWAFFLRNVKNDWFVQQSTTRKFTETLEDLLISPRTSPVVRERLLAVVAAAAFASGIQILDFVHSGKELNLMINRKRFLAYLVKFPHKANNSDKGMPLDDNDPMFTFPVSNRFQYDNNIPQVVYQEPSTFPVEFPTTLTPRTKTSRKHKTPESRNRIISLDEDIRRLFQECKLGQGNASLLSQALALSRPEDLKTTDVIKEFYLKCRSSQELIFAQISWASAEAEKSRVTKNQEALVTGQPEEQRLEQTIQEKLLGSLLSANAELMDALQQYDDLERVAIERMTEEVSRKETKMDRRQLQQLQQDGDHLSDSSHVVGRGSSEATHISRSRSSSPMPGAQTPYHHHHTHSTLSHSELSGGGLAPPRPAPHGPRLPAQGNMYVYTQSRTPSPPTPIRDEYEALQNGVAGMRLRKESVPSVMRSSVYQEEEEVPAKPSEKALGKQRVVEEDTLDHYGQEDILDGRDETYSVDSRLDSDDDRSTHEGWPYHRQQQQFVYDAVAERTQQRIREGQTLLVNGVQ